MTDSRTSSALFKRAEQLKRWEESDTNKQSPTPKRASKIQFSPEVVFLAACSSGDKDEVKRLLDIGADINTGNVDGLTALHQACIDDNLDMVEFLVIHGADVNRGDNEGWTPLHATASCGFLSIARYLLENGADVAAVNYDGELPLDITESEDMEEYLRKVIDQKGIDCEKARRAEVDNLMSDAKYWAANGYTEVRDPKTGGTPLHVSSAKGYLDVIKTLLEDCNAEPDCMDYEGWTPLHAAALWGQKDAVALLLKHGADPNLKNYSGQTCMDLADPNISAWLAEATRRFKSNKRKRSPPQRDLKRVDLQLESQPDKIVNGNNKPEKPKPPVTTDNDTSLRRAHSFETDNTFYQRYRDVTARIKATSCPTIPPLPQSAHGVVDQRKKNQEATNNNNNNNVMETVNANEEVQTRINPSERRDRLANTWTTSANTSANSSPTNTTTQTTVRSSSESVESNSSNSTPSATTPTKLSPGNIFKNFFKSFVPPVRDEESETQRKAHAKRVRETRRSTQGVTLDELKSAEQLVKKRAGNGTTESSTNSSNKVEDGPVSANTENSTFELEDASQSSSKASTSADTTVTLPLRRPPSGSSVTTTLSPSKEDNRTADDEKDRDSSSESKSSSGVSPATPASTQAALNVIQRRRRPKRRSTGVGHVDMDEIANERGRGGDGDSEDAFQSGSERTDDGEEPRDYKALYEASESEVRRLRALLATSEQQLRDARATITTLSQVNQSSSLSEIEKREKRAMERKLSEMEEELKQLQKLKAENERLRAENRALTRVVSKLTNSATK